MQGGGQADRACEVYGAHWSYSYPWPGREEGRPLLVQRIEQAGATLLRGDEDLLLARLDESDDSRLWMRISLASDSVHVSLVRERMLLPEASMTFTLDDGERNEFTFYTEHPGERFQRMDVRSAGGAIDFKGVWLREGGELRHTIDYSHVCHQEHGPLHELSRVSLPRERFWDIPVPKIDSPTRQPLLPR
ncbi:MAG: hypothetical protein AB2807_01810, partial [Candidatus Sedimenticola endophacoides]